MALPGLASGRDSPCPSKLRGIPEAHERLPGGRVSTILKTFQPRFAELVKRGEKLQTIRSIGNYTPKVGDKILLRAWTGKPRRSSQAILGEGIIIAVDSVQLKCLDGISISCIIDGVALSREEFAAMAMLDGFSCVTDMIRWFESTHGLPFEGILIKWRKTKLKPNPNHAA